MLQYIQDEADGLHGEGRDQVMVSGLFSGDGLKPEPALVQQEPALLACLPESR